MTTIIIDDEPDAVESLELIITDYLPDLKVVNTFTDPQLALKKIPIIKPELIFLDINMPGLNGFELLEQLENTDFHVIFTTAYDEYAIKAFKFGVANYLLKPIDIEELTEAVSRLIKKESFSLSANKIHQEADKLRNAVNDKIAVNSPYGVNYLKSSDILYIASAESSVKIYLHANKQIPVKKTLKDFENVMPAHFLRIHNSFIINILYVKKLIKTERWSVEMDDGEILPIARRKRNEFLDLMNRTVDQSTGI
ncbi:MAG: LytTR family DNA-binding domain-containing protein [Bacteroidales bacterium]|nr:LytTR family DNA-binding domain-containing protein [Bacteroidales bacterium]